MLMFSEFGRHMQERAARDRPRDGWSRLPRRTPVRGGLIGAPDLANLDEGDLKFAVDFRDVYATLLRRWVNVDPVPILGRQSSSAAVLILEDVIIARAGKPMVRLVPVRESESPRKGGQ